MFFQVGTYADGFVASAAAMYLGVTIRLVTSVKDNGTFTIEPPNMEGKLRQVTMGYLLGKHYYAAIPVHNHSGIVFHW